MRPGRTAAVPEAGAPARRHRPVGRGRDRRGTWRTAALLALCVAAAPAQAESLADVLADVYVTSPVLRAERAALRAVDEGMAQARSGWRPTVVVSGSYGLRDSEQSFSGRRDVESSTTPRAADITISQNLFRGFRTEAATLQARHDVAAARARLLSVEQDVLLAGVRVFSGVLRDRATVELNRGNVAVLERQLEATRDRFRVGELTRTDVSQAEARLQRAVSELVNAEGSLARATAAFVNVVGRPPRELEVSPVAIDLPASADDVIAAAGADDPDVLAAEYAERAARARIEVVRGELLPTLSLRGKAEIAEDVAGDGTGTEATSVTANLSIPLYQSGAVASRVREARQRASAALSDLRAARRASVERATSAWENLVTAHSRIIAFESQVRAQEIALEGVREEARVGARTTLDVLDAEQELLDSRVNLVTARRDDAVAAHEVLHAAGRLTARSLALPVELYDFTANYDDVSRRIYGTGILDE